jgi:hypothetical protein
VGASRESRGSGAMPLSAGTRQRLGYRPQPECRRWDGVFRSNRPTRVYRHREGSCQEGTWRTRWQDPCFPPGLQGGSIRRNVLILGRDT